MDSLRLDSAVRFAMAREIGWSRNLAEQVATNTRAEPYPDVLGPTTDRAGPSGVVVRGGYIVAEWGDTRRVDMTFSVAKSYLATVGGLAFDDGLIPDLQARVGASVTDGGFDSPHNAQITWHHLFTQTSEWEGTLWDKPDVADRRRGRDRTLNAPGTFWEYNDVRVNRTALALLRVWRRPLPEVLKQRIMDPIGASNAWVWHGYRNSYVDLNGQRVQSVSGGGHWGGGVWASTRDHARFGLLMLRRGRWGTRQLLSERWIAMAETPVDLRPNYGYMWWLNTNQAQFRNAPASSVFALGAGGNMIWIDRENDLLVVVRWMDNRATNEFIGLVQSAIQRDQGWRRLLDPPQATLLCNVQRAGPDQLRYTFIEADSNTRRTVVARYDTSGTPMGALLVFEGPSSESRRAIGVQAEFSPTASGAYLSGSEADSLRLQEAIAASRRDLAVEELEQVRGFMTMMWSRRCRQLPAID